MVEESVEWWHVKVKKAGQSNRALPLVEKHVYMRINAGHMV